MTKKAELFAEFKSPFSLKIMDSLFATQLVLINEIKDFISREFGISEIDRLTVNTSLDIDLLRKETKANQYQRLYIYKKGDSYSALFVISSSIEEAEHELSKSC